MSTYVYFYLSKHSYRYLDIAICSQSLRNQRSLKAILYNSLIEILKIWIKGMISRKTKQTKPDSKRCKKNQLY